ncbi:uncharacterized protein LOC109862193 [Pseudomyrmex gracilis]|uniref:uncharacterized protein LOC109862193 n=1 Tax=Pseudomyrmex gracilis TaxID=219809 RepID=UPI00099528F7|nr:uncharacterized protein LOC109862193 [Pseudomyrmex gracilis]
MEFMRDSLLIKKTETSTLEIADNSTELLDDQSSQASSSDNSRKRKNSKSERLEILSKFADSLATPISSLVLSPPPQRQQDEISAFLEFQGYRLRTMDERKQSVMQMIFNIINEDDS